MKIATQPASADVPGGSSVSPPDPPIHDVKNEVRQLLEEKLMGTDDTAKTEAFHTLASYFMDTADDEVANLQQEERRRVVAEWNGCHLALIVLRQELARSDGPNRDVVHGAIRFLAYWNYDSPERCDAFSRFDGVATIADALRATPDDDEIATGAISCLLNFTGDGDANRLSEIADYKAHRAVFLAMPAHVTNANVQKLALTLLDAVVEALDQQQHILLVKDGVLRVVATVFEKFAGADPKIWSLCSKLLKKLCI